MGLHAPDMGSLEPLARGAQERPRCGKRCVNVLKKRKFWEIRRKWPVHSIERARPAAIRRRLRVSRTRVRTRCAANAVANFGFKRGTRVTKPADRFHGPCFDPC